MSSSLIGISLSFGARRAHALPCHPRSPIILGPPLDEPLARLVAFEPTTFPVLSVCLNPANYPCDR